MKHIFRCAALAAFLSTACGGSALETVTNPSVVAAASIPASLALPATVDKAFDPNVLHEIRFTMSPDDWATLKAQYLLDDYYAASISIDGEAALFAGIRSRGGGTRNGIKPALKLSFDKFVNKQVFHGLKSINLKNVTADESMLREYLALPVYQAMGIETPAAAMAHLTVNGEDYGIFTMVEQIDKTWLTARFAENGGDLFSYQWIDKWDFSPRGDNAADYYPAPIEPETNEDTFDPKPLMDFATNAYDDTDQTLEASLSPYVDVSKVVTFVATEEALAERDGLVGDYGMNNIYLYQATGGTRFTLIPWDRDSCLRDAFRPTDSDVSDNVLASRLLKQGDLAAEFKAKLKEAAQNYVNPTWLGARLERGYELIHSAALADTKKPYTNADFEAGVAALRNVIALRAQSLGATAN